MTSSYFTMKMPPLILCAQHGFGLEGRTGCLFLSLQHSGPFQFQGPLGCAFAALPRCWPHRVRTASQIGSVGAARGCLPQQGQADTGQV